MEECEDETSVPPPIEGGGEMDRLRARSAVDAQAVLLGVSIFIGSASV